MSIRVKIFIGLIVFIVVVGGIVGFFVWRANQSKKVAPSSPQASNQATAGQAAESRQPSASEQPKAESRVSAAQVSAAAREAAIKNQVKNFVERFGSYSQDANYANFEELQSIITASVAQWLKDYPKTLKEKEPVGFVGVTTFVVSQKINKADASSAEVLASVQREETTTAGVNRYYKDILVKLVLVGDTWKVDGAYWQ